MLTPKGNRAIITSTTTQRDNEMTNLNTKANRNTILNRIEKDGVNLSEFNEDQKIQLIKVYAATCLNEGII